MSDSATTTVAARLATRDDLAALEANETERTRGLSATYLDAQDRGDFYLVVGTLGDQIAGRVILDCRDDDAVLVPEMKLLWVFPQFRRRGLGAAMTQELELLARRLNYDEIFLGVSADNNPAAIPLYVSLGYTPTGDHRNAVNLSVIDGSQTETETADSTEAIFRKSLRVR